MNEIVKECIRRIDTDSALQGKTFGRLCKDILCPKDKRALLLNEEQRSYYILANKDKIGAERRIMTEFLAELLNMLDFLLKEHLIYKIHETDNYLGNLQLYYEPTIQCEVTQIEDKFDCGNGIILTYQDYTYNLLSSGGDLLTSSTSDSHLYESLKSWLSSYIFPAPELKDYIKRGFMTEEKYTTKKSLSISKTSTWIAISVAVLTPIVTLLLSNCFGVARINSKQFDTLINHMSELQYNSKATHCDTTITHCDTTSLDTNQLKKK